MVGPPRGTSMVGKGMSGPLFPQEQWDWGLMLRPTPVCVSTLQGSRLGEPPEVWAHPLHSTAHADLGVLLGSGHFGLS